MSSKTKFRCLMVFVTVLGLGFGWNFAENPYVGTHAASLAEASLEADGNAAAEAEESPSPSDAVLSDAFTGALTTARTIVQNGMNLDRQRTQWDSSANEIQQSLRGDVQQLRDAVSGITDPELKQDFEGFRKVNERMVKRTWTGFQESRRAVDEAIEATRNLEGVVIACESGQSIAKECTSLSEISSDAHLAAASQLAEVKGELAKFELPNPQRIAQAR